MRERTTTSSFLIRPQSVCILLSLMLLLALSLAVQDHEMKANSNASENMLAPVQSTRFTPLIVPDFTLSASPTTVAVSVGAAGASTITVAPVNGFTGTVTLTSSVSPSTGLTCSLSPASVTLVALDPSKTSTLSCSGSAGPYTVTVTGTSGALVHSATVAFTVQDFTFTASPTSVTGNVNTALTSTITVTGLQDFSGVVSLTATISPSTGLACTLTPTSVAGSGTSTLSCTATVSGTYTVTITGTSGTLSHTATVTVTINPTEFTVIASPTSVTTLAGATGTSTITVTPVNGFTGTVALSLTVSPSTGIACDLNPTSITLGAAQTSTLSCSGSAGVYTVTVTGTSATLSHPVTVTVTVQDFAITSSAPSQANVGGTATAAITVSSLYGFTGSVRLTSDNPNSCTLKPDSVILGTSSGSVLSCTSTIVGQFLVVVTGSPVGVFHSTNVAMNFGDFSIQAIPATIAIQSGAAAASTITLSNNGYNGQVALIPTLPIVAGLSVAINPASVTLLPGLSQSTTLTISTTAFTPSGTYSILIRSDSIVSHSLNVAVLVGGNFTMTLAKPQMVVVEGASANTTVTLSSLGMSGVVTLYTIPPVNSGVHGRFNPPLVQLTPGLASSTALTIDASTVMFPGVYNVTLVGEGGSVRRLIYLNLTVSDFSIMINPSPISVPPGQVGNTTISVHGLFSFNGTVNLVTYPLRQIQPSLASNSLMLNSTSPLLNSTLTIRVAGSTLPGVYYIRVTGTVGRLVHTVFLKLSVVEFSINISPSIILQVGQPLPTTLTIISQNGFAGTVNLNFTVPLESGLTGQISPSSIGLLSNATSSATLTLTGLRPGVYRMNVTGTSEIAHSFQYVTVYVGDFSVSSSSPSIVVIVGTTKTFQVNLASNFLFSGMITLSTICDSQSLDISNVGNATVLSARTTTIVITISATRGTPGVYNLTIVGTNGSLLHSVSVRVLVASPPSLNAPGVETVNQGSLLTFSVTAADSDPTLTISYNTLPPGATTPSPGLPPGATFYPSYRTNSTMTILTGIFDWKPSSNQTPGDYVITFTVQDRNGGVSSRQVTLHVNNAGSRPPIIPSSPLVWYSLIAVVGIAGTLVGSRIWRNRNLRAFSHDEDAPGDLEI